ncbi:MAG: SprT-like domain-containing protein [Flavobacteriales bacterium]
MNVLGKAPQKSQILLEAHLSQFNGEVILSKPRKTKLGDFRINISTGKCRISINSDLNKYSFLITLLHELAHYFTWKKHGNSVQPHGLEWKTSFQELASPYINESVFPPDISEAFTNYLKNPKASSCSDQKLFRSINAFNNKDSEYSYISELRIGSLFSYGNKGMFRILEKKRKRFLCFHLESEKNYLFQPITRVKLLTPS